MSIKSIADIINDNLNEFESPEDVEDLFYREFCTFRKSQI